MDEVKLKNQLRAMGFDDRDEPTRFKRVVDADRRFVVVETGRTDGLYNCGLYARHKDETEDESRDPFCGHLVRTPEHMRRGGLSGSTAEQVADFIRQFPSH